MAPVPSFRRAAGFLLVLAGCQGTVELVEEPTAGTGAGPGVGGSTTGPSMTGSGGSSMSSGAQAGTGTGGAGPSSGGAGSGGTSSSGGSGQPACTSSASIGAPVPMRRLTATQVERTIRDLFDLELKLEVRDERLIAYRSNISTTVDATSARGYFDFANAVVSDADLSRCESDCSAWLLDEIGLRLFRRPLTDDERDRYAALYELGEENGDTQEAAGWVLEAMLQSPSFLYLDEGVKSDGTLDDHALAARLSLLLWGANPDAELLERAADGELSTPDAVENEVRRMLADERAEAGIREFVDQWFDLGRLDDPDVRPDLAELGAATVAALRDEPVQYFRRLLADGAGLGELLTSSRTLPSSALEALYADDIVSRSADAFELDPERRSGVLSLPGVVAALSHARRTSPTLRGKAVLTGLLCTPPEPPPADVDTTLPEIADDVSTRERLEQHMANPACRGCHAGMDGIGFALEKLDWLGRYREEDSGTAIDDSSTFPLGDGEVTVHGPAELAHALAETPDVAACLSRQWLRYSLGITETKAVDCLVEELAERARGENGLELMIVTALVSDWFRRGPEEAP